MSTPDAVFSTTERVVLAPSMNTGATSFTLLTSIVTAIETVRLPSETVTVTAWVALVS